MIYTALTTALVAFSTFTDALPSTSSTQGKFTVNQQEHGKKLRSGPVAMEATYKKFGVKVPDNIKKASAAAQQGSVSATPEDSYDSAYLSPVLVGTSGQTLMLDFDTGSSDLWVFSTLQPSSQTSGHTIYNPSSSSTSRQLSGETWKITYGDGSGAGGIIYSDRVVIGGVTATSQAVEAATSVSSSFSSNTDTDGLVGLAFDNINTARPSQVKTFMDNVAPTLTSPLFCARLKYHTAGSYDFGFIDTSKYSGTLSYASVSKSQGFWEFVFSGYSIGSTRYSGNVDAIADTGTTLVYLPSSIVSAYYSKVSGAQNNSGAGGYIFPCSATLPTFGIYVNGVQYYIPGNYINYAPYTSGYCFGGIQSSSGIGINILGDIFLKSQYVVFDYGNTRIGFGQGR